MICIDCTYTHTLKHNYIHHSLCVDTCRHNYIPQHCVTIAGIFLVCLKHEVSADGKRAPTSNTGVRNFHVIVRVHQNTTNHHHVYCVMYCTVYNLGADSAEDHAVCATLCLSLEGCSKEEKCGGASCSSRSLLYSRTEIGQSLAADNQ